MAEQQVCSIDFYINMLFVFGLNRDFGPSRRACWMSTVYCLFVSVVFIFCMYLYSEVKSLNNTFLLIVMAAEYLSRVLISMIKKNMYLLQYYKEMNHIDDISNARVYKTLRACLMALVAVIIFLKIIVHSFFYYIYWGRANDLSIFTMTFEIIMFIITVSARLPIVFVLSLLYCRVRFMRTTLEGTDLNCNSESNHHPRRYIQMYETIMDTFEETDNPVKLQLFIFYLLSLPYYIQVLITLLQTARHNNLELLFTLWVLLDIAITYMPITISAILSDLITEEVQEMLGIVVEKRIKSKNERDYSEIQKLFKYLKSRPFNYIIWRVIPLNVRTLLTLTSFCITTIIAILQLKSLNI